MAPSLDEFAAVGRPKQQHCWFQRLDPGQQEKATAAHEAGYSHPTIAKVVNGWGIPISRGRVGEHFRGACSCPS